MSQNRPIVVLTTGDPVPIMLETRGPFARLIQERIGDAWKGDYAAVDVRTSDPPNPRAAAAFILTGSAANVWTRDPWMLRTEAWLRDVVPLGIPVFGICFGHQILAQALGGEVIRNPRGREIGTRRIEKLADDILLDGLPSAFEANATHLDTVGRLPAGAQVLARSGLDECQAIRFSSTCYGVQFHPEIDADVMRGYILSRREILLQEGFEVDPLLAAVTDGLEGLVTLRNFIKHVLPLGAR
ncbi:MAG: glutamine amidotransferase [Polyangiaceae bacterium]|nr:glutamine amidotransferase [Polyangiaceae bacterium]